MDWSTEASTLSLYKRSFVLELLHTTVQNFYYQERNQRKISLLGIHPSIQARQVEEGLRMIDELIAAVERNVGCGNLKRAFHFHLVLRQHVKQTQSKLDAIDYFELVG